MICKTVSKDTTNQLLDFVIYKKNIKYKTQLYQ